MPNVSSPLGTANSAIPLVRADQLGQLAGIPMHFASFSAFTTAVAAEQANVSAGSALWADGQPISVASETVARARRVWSTSLNHARTVTVGEARFVLAGDNNTVIITSGVPATGTGANGDAAVDWAGGVIYQKTSSTWASIAATVVSDGSITLAKLAADASAALNAKAPLASPTFTGTVSGVSKTAVGLSNVDNTADVNKPLSSADIAALALKAPLASPAFTGTVTGVTKAMVGLTNVDNTADVNKPVSTAQAAAIAAVVQNNLNASTTAAPSATAVIAALAGLGGGGGSSTAIDGGTPSSTYGGTTAIFGGTP